MDKKRERHLHKHKSKSQIRESLVFSCLKYVSIGYVLHNSGPDMLNASSGRQFSPLLRLEEQYSVMSDVEVDEVFCFCEKSASCEKSRKQDPTMGDKTTKIPSYDTVPGSALSLIKLGRY